jgi:pimeloyl-ACP methyl ester carboxylesterase
LLALTLAASLTLVPASAVHADPPDPQPLPPTGDCIRDNVFYGVVPPGGEQSPVIVFVHGYSGLAIDWWLRLPPYFDNDSYVRAYNAGYRTAFVNLNVDPDAPNCEVARLPSQSVIYNGFVLGRQLQAITENYGVGQVDVVAHSKGGIDTQAALLWFGGASKVRNVFTLGTPHQGSILADLLWSPQGIWLGWLLGRLDPATYSLQTGPMQVFRVVADASTVDDAVDYYSGAGTEWDNGGAGLAAIGAWLAAQPNGGINDGAVTVNSTFLPYAATLFQQPWNHFQVYMGENALPYIIAVLQGDGAGVIDASGSALAVLQPIADRGQAVTPDAPRAVPLTSIVHGGLLRRAAEERLTVEPQARSIQFSLLTLAGSPAAAMVAPDGTIYRFSAAQNADYGPAAMASIQQVTVWRPGAGAWRLEVEGQHDGGYLLVADVKSGLQIQLEGLPNRIFAPGETLRLRAVAASGYSVQQMAVQLSTRSGDISELDATGARLDVPLIQDQGYYGMSVTVRGQAANGLPFERTLVRSIAVMEGDELTGDYGG